MSTPVEQDATNPNSLLYYAPRRLRERADALRTTQQLDNTLVPESDVPFPVQHDQHAHLEPLPRISRSARRESIESLSRRNQRISKKQVFAPVLRFAAVASMAAAIAFTYVLMTEMPDQNAGKDITGSVPKIADGTVSATVNETAPPAAQATNTNQDDVIVLRGSSANASAAIATPLPQPAPAPVVETTGSRESSPPISFEQFQQFLLWQQTMAQAPRQEPSLRQAPATRDPAPRRKRKSRRHQADDDE